MPPRDKTKVPDGRVSLVVAVSGHRDLDPAEAESVRQRMTDVLRRLTDCYRHTPIVVLTGMAEGADQLVVEVVDELRHHGYACVDYRPVLPMPADLYVAGFKTEEGKETFRRQMKDREYTLLPVHPCHTLEQIAVPGSAERRQQYRDLADFLVKASQILIAVWDGETGRPGGTAEVVDRKLGRYRPPENAHECETKHHLRQRASYGMGINSFGLGPVYHIAAQREGKPDVSPDAAANWKYPEEASGEGDEAQAKAFAGVYLLLDEFNRDVRSHQRLTSEVQHKFDDQTGSAVTHCTSGMEWIAGVRSWAAVLARHYKSQNDWILKAVFVCLAVSGVAVHLREQLAAMGGIVATVYYTGAVFALLLWAWDNGWVGYRWRRVKERLGLADQTGGARRRKSGTSPVPTDEHAPLACEMPRAGLKHRRKHEDYRALSEALRVQYNWLAAGIKRMAAEDYLDKHVGDMVWVRDATSDTLLYEFGADAESSGHDVLSHNLNEAWIKGQIKYFEDHSKDGERKHSRLYRTGLLFFLAGLLGPVAEVLLEWKPPAHSWISWQPVVLANWQQSILDFGPSLTMFCAVLIWSFAELKGYEQESQQYRQMKEFYRRAHRQLMTLLKELQGIDPAHEHGLRKQKELIREFLQRVGRGALAESGDWLSMHRGRDLKISLGAGQ